MHFIHTQLCISYIRMLGSNAWNLQYLHQNNNMTCMHAYTFMCKQILDRNNNITCMHAYTFICKYRYWSGLFKFSKLCGVYMKIITSHAYINIRAYMHIRTYGHTHRYWSGQFKFSKLCGIYMNIITSHAYIHIHTNDILWHFIIYIHAYMHICTYGHTHRYWNGQFRFLKPYGIYMKIRKSCIGMSIYMYIYVCVCVPLKALAMSIHTCTHTHTYI
jgi:hypothetical protein